jgi:hypothetical protein
MTNKDIFKIWAPSHKKWVDWVRPVPFVTIGKNIQRFYPSNITLPFVSCLENKKSIAIIVDLPNTQSVEAGIFLSQYGYRPIPIYNGTMEQNGVMATTDNKSIQSALIWGAVALSNIKLPDDAPPAFLTDTNRLQRHKANESVFDNSWDVYHQDLPTEDYFLNNGIEKIIVVSNKLSKDLKDIFAEYPHKKIQIFLTNGYDEPRCIRKGR